MKEQEWHKANERWAYRLWLGDWDLRSIWTEDGAPDDSDKFHVAASAHTTPAYEMAAVTGHAQVLKDMTSKQGDKIACHENVHVLLTDWNIFVGDLIGQLPKQAQALARSRQEELWENVVTRVTKVLTSTAIAWKNVDPRNGRKL